MKSITVCRHTALVLGVVSTVYTKPVRDQAPCCTSLNPVSSSSPPQCHPELDIYQLDTPFSWTRLLSCARKMLRFTYWTYSIPRPTVPHQAVSHFFFFFFGGVVRASPEDLWALQTRFRGYDSTAVINGCAETQHSDNSILRLRLIICCPSLMRISKCLSFFSPAFHRSVQRKPVVRKNSFMLYAR